MDNNRYNEMNEFLKYYAKIYEQNPNFSIENNTIYAGLMSYGYSNDELERSKNVDYDGLFNHWINRFSNSRNLNVYRDDRQYNFLQFWNSKGSDADCIKIYLSFDTYDIDYCISKIFDFIDKNDIATKSKIANKLRADDVVLRIFDINDAIKVINYINSDSDLVNCARKTNPFMVRHGALGVAFDDWLSYNDTLAEMISNYFKECRNNNDFRNVSVEDFQQYVKNYHNDIFKNPNNLHKFKGTSMFLLNKKRFDSDGDCILNYDNVIDLITKQLDPNFNINNFLDVYKKVSNPNNKSQMAQYYNDILDNKISYNATPKKENEVNKKDLLDRYIQYAATKYGVDEVHKYLESYVYQNNHNAITKDNNFRNNFLKYLNKQDILYICQNNISSYIYAILGISNIQNTTNVNQNIDNQNANYKYELFVNACVATLQKYGDEQLNTAITEAMTKGNYNYFTNGNTKLRNQMINLITPQDIQHFHLLYLKQIGYNLDNISSTITLFCHAIKEQLKEINKDKMQN